MICAVAVREDFVVIRARQRNRAGAAHVVSYVYSRSRPGVSSPGRAVVAAPVAGASPPDYCSGSGFASAVSAGGTIDLDLCPAPVTINIGDTELIVTHDTTVEYTVPSGGDPATITASGHTRLFEVRSPATLTLSGLQLTGGDVLGTAARRAPPAWTGHAGGFSGPGSVGALGGPGTGADRATPGEQRRVARSSSTRGRPPTWSVTSSRTTAWRGDWVASGDSGALGGPAAPAHPVTRRCPASMASPAVPVPQGLSVATAAPAETPRGR